MIGVVAKTHVRPPTFSYWGGGCHPSSPSHFLRFCIRMMRQSMSLNDVTNITGFVYAINRRAQNRT